jgi:energy-coupling factor transporter ATP-binding protein EcfA2
MNANNTPTANTVEQIEAVAKAALASDNYLRILGRSGGGKTTLAAMLAKALGIDAVRVKLVNFSGSLPSQVIGQLMPDAASRESWRTKPIDPFLLILDEFESWEQSIQCLFHGLKSPDGQPTVGSHELPKNLFVVLTGNRREDAAASNTGKAPIVGRSSTIEWLPTVKSWADHEGSAAAASPIAAFLGYAAKAGSEVADFFCPAPPKPWRGEPYPQPREWSAALAVESSKAWPADPALQNLILASKVGQSAADACCAFLSLAKKILPLMDSILKGEASLPTSPQDRYAIAHCAIRRAIDMAGNDPEAAVAGGKLDPIIERILLPLGPEMRIWSFSAAKAAGIPLELHRAQAQLQNLNL